MKKTLLFAAIFTMAGTLHLNAQIITTIAGTGIAGNTGVGGPATAAELYAPCGVFADVAGNVFIADHYNSLIQKINTAGIITNVAGNGSSGYSGDGGPATAAEVNIPEQIYVDATGNIFIADYFNSRIRKVNTNGIITTVVGNGTAGYSGDGGQATTAEIYTPTDVTLDISGNMYITDYSTATVRKVNTNGIISTIAGTGTGGYSGDGGPATAAEIDHPWGIAVDRSGLIYISDDFNYRVRKIDLSGNISTFAGNGTPGHTGIGGPATAAEIGSPCKVTVDNYGNVYFVDFTYSAVYMVNNGIITNIAGVPGGGGFGGDGGPATAALFSEPAGIFADNANQTVYVGDNLNHRVRQFTFPFLGIPTVEKNGNTRVFPNPTNGKVFVNIPDEQVTNKSFIEVYNTLGESVYKGTLVNTITEIDLSGKPNGVYLYRITSEQGKLVSSGKLVLAY